MLKTPTGRIFPLHLAPIDNFFLLDDRPDYPMTFVSNLFFTGTFDKSAFQAALDDALLLHPLLHATIGLAKLGKMCWLNAGKDRSPTVDWGGLDDPLDIEEREVIDLKHETGLRVWVRQGEGQARLILQFHHACCDGTGAHRFMGDLLASYGIRTATESAQPEIAEYNPRLLKGRRLKLTEEFSNGSILLNVRRSVGQGIHVFGRRISPLAVARGTRPKKSTKASALPGVVSHTFDREQHKRLRHAAAEQRVMLNDLMLSEMFQAMQDWNVEQGVTGSQRLRIMMPSDMRDKEDYAMPAANMTSYNFITRQTKDFRNSPQLVRGIRDETARIKHEQRGRIFIDSITAAAKYIPRLVPFLLSRSRCLSTVTVSHMGDPTRRFLATFPRRNGKLVCGDVVLDNMVGVSPLRPQTRAAVSFVTLYRELTINIRCDPHKMILEDSARFLEIYVDRLASHL